MNIIKIFLPVIIFIGCANNALATATLINTIEEQIFKIIFSDCTKVQSIFGYNYENVATQAFRKLKSVYLNLYTPNGLEKHFIQTASQTLPTSVNFNNLFQTVIISHGYLGDADFENPVKLARDLQSFGNLNVLTLDHSSMTRDNYFLASTNTRYVGEALGYLLSNLYTRGFRDFHLIGHSIGAHMSGFAAKVYKKNTGTLIQRITGLDVAGPCFYHEVSDKRLTKTDATFVDVIHTDIDALGITIPIGHVDFYPNSGRNMPGCLILCGHVRAFEYFIESVNTYSRNSFMSVKCASWDAFLRRECTGNSRAPMGYWLQNNVEEGLYYLITAKNAPYGLGINGIM